MTIVTATAAPEIGVLSADTLFYSHFQFGSIEHADTSDGTPEAFMRATWCGDGTPPKVVPLEYVPKVHAIPRLKMAIACAGMPVSKGWAQEIEASGATDILDVDAIAPGILRKHCERVHVYAPTSIFHVGWSARAGRVVGFYYGSHTDWQSEPFTGHRFGIIPHPEFIGHDDMVNTFESAAQGIGTEAWHIAMAKNVEAAYRAGKALRWLHFGGDLLVARVDRNGVSVRPAFAFKGAVPLNVLAHPYGLS